MQCFFSFVQDGSSKMAVMLPRNSPVSIHIIAVLLDPSSTNSVRVHTLTCGSQNKQLFDLLIHRHSSAVSPGWGIFLVDILSYSTYVCASVYTWPRYQVLSLFCTYNFIKSGCVHMLDGQVTFMCVACYLPV